MSLHLAFTFFRVNERYRDYKATRKRLEGNDFSAEFSYQPTSGRIPHSFSSHSGT